MSYQVIARKFRPATFDELVGQEPVVRALKNAIELGRIAHAYVFSGPRGTGKTTTARILAKMLNCQQGPTVHPCLQCASCTEIAAAGSIDVIEIDGASNRGINEIRDLKEKISYRPGRDRFKIYIIDEVHMLTTEAFNALLKTLEEPPAHVKFIFATTEAHKIPRTILSRCQRYTFRLLPPRQVEEHLKRILESEGVPFDEDALRVIVNETEGSVRDAQSLLEQAIAASAGSLSAEVVREILGLSDRSDLLGLAEAVRGGDAQRVLDTLERTASYGGDVSKLGIAFLRLLRDLTTAKLGLSHEAWRVLTRHDEALVARLTEGTDFDYWYRLYRLWTRAVDEIQRSVLPRETAEVALLRLARTPTALDVGQLAEAIHALKRSTPAAPLAEATPGLDAPAARPAAPAIPAGPSRPFPGPRPFPEVTRPAAQAPAAQAPAAPAPSAATTPAAPFAAPSPARPAPSPFTVPAPAVPSAPPTRPGAARVERFEWEVKAPAQAAPAPAAPVQAAPAPAAPALAAPVSVQPEPAAPVRELVPLRTPAPTPVEAPPAALTLEPPSPEPDPDPEPEATVEPAADEPSAEAPSTTGIERDTRSDDDTPPLSAYESDLDLSADLADAALAEAEPAPLLPEVPRLGEAPEASPLPQVPLIELSAESFPRVRDRLAVEAQVNLRGLSALLAELQLVELQGATVVLGIPLSSPHALLADKLRARRGDVQDALKRITGRDVVVDWTEVRPPAREGTELTEKERLRREVEQLPIFQQVQVEFGASLRLGDERR